MKKRKIVGQRKWAQIPQVLSATCDHLGITRTHVQHTRTSAMRLLLIIAPIVLSANGVLRAGAATTLGADGTNPPGSVTWNLGISFPNPLTVHDGTGVVFQWNSGAGTHSVYQLTDASAWSSCSFTGATPLVPAASSAQFTLDTTGLAGSTVYIACNVDSHCLSGLKVQVSVVAGNTATLAPSKASSAAARDASLFGGALGLLLVAQLIRG
jgi:hypothetical protein